MFFLPKITYWLIPTCCALMTAFMHCKPPLLGSFLLCQKEWSSPIWKWLELLLLASIEFAMAMQCCISAGHYVLFSQIFGIVMLFGRCQELATLKNAKVAYLVKGYRQLQIQEKIHNSSYRGRILPFSILCIPLMEILSGVALIAVFHKANLLLTSSFLVTYMDCIVVGMLMLTFASSVYVKTEVWLNHAQSKSGKGKTIRYFRMVRQSFRPLRLEFGNNFVDRLTPLVMQEFCCRQTATLLLLARV